MDFHVNPWVILIASPRPRGNSEHAAGLAAERLRGAGASVDTVRLREHAVAPCAACGLCASEPGVCSLDPDRGGRPDDAAAIFARLRAATGLIVVSPVYFYGLPAQFKALVDRSQRCWLRTGPQTGRPESLSEAPKPAYAILPAGRVRGERLFDGSLLSLRPFVRLLGFRLRDHLPLRGLDGPEALAERPDLCAGVLEWAARIPG